MAQPTTLKSEETGDADVRMSVDNVDVQPKRSPSAFSELKDEDSTPTPPPSSKSKSETPAPVRNGKPGPQLIDYLPRAEAEALKMFEELSGNHYQYSTLGRSREALESMTCDCQFVPGEDDPDTACGEESDCINRLTQVECVEGDCRCRAHCRNQRMQRRQHANIEIVLTEKKGFGLRAGSDIRKDAFIYEYIGDVVSQPSFVKRMRDYAEEGIRHFYFMMLQKDEYIDATKRGGIGRFANHSCNPNCYVAKWTVGQHVRMGIYAKRNIKKNEELTFNYNVDRYGHDAQPCYCGEPKCVGFLGGKTQTDVAAMDDLYLDALGISEEVEMYGLKGSKKKRGKKLDEDYVPILKPLVEKDVPKVVQAVRQTQSRKVLLKLLTRIKMTEDQPALRQLMRLRGYSLMCNMLEDFITDIDICMNVIECISTWPLLQRNKIEDSKIEEPVRVLTQSENEKLRSLALELMAHWATLEVGYRIPKRQKLEGDGEGSPATPELNMFEEEQRSNKRNRKGQLHDLVEVDPSLLSHLKPLGRTTVQLPTSAQFPPLRGLGKSEGPELPRIKWAHEVREERAAIIASATRAVQEAKRLEEEKAAAAAAKAAAEAAESARKSKRPRDKAKRKSLSIEEKEGLKEKKLLKLVGAVVVKCMSKYQKRMDHDTFKKHAKELTQLIVEKEKKSNSYQSGKLDALSDEKVTKIKKFAKEYIAKLLRRLEKSGSSRRPPDSRDSGSGSVSGSGSRHAATTAASTPQAGASADAAAEHELNVADTLDLGADESEDEEGDGDEDESGDPSPASDTRGPEPVVAVVGRDVDADVEMTMGNVRATFVVPSTPPPPPTSARGKRSRWDQGPTSGVSISKTGSSSSVYAGL
ncbi:hypothetical protein M0805_005632 [Coniferiporia weirii]|nr:hypothetical protein M0805_005632 [Coniferiporia weirii]